MTFRRAIEIEDGEGLPATPEELDELAAFHAKCTAPAVQAALRKAQDDSDRIVTPGVQAALRKMRDRLDLPAVHETNNILDANPRLRKRYQHLSARHAPGLLRLLRGRAVNAPRPLLVRAHVGRPVARPGVRRRAATSSRGDPSPSEPSGHDVAPRRAS